MRTQSQECPCDENCKGIFYFPIKKFYLSFYIAQQAILSAILSGERNPKVLATLVDYRVKASPQKIEEALTGFWQKQHLFELQQCWDAFHFHQKQIQQCDEAIDQLLPNKTQKEHLDCLE